MESIDSAVNLNTVGKVSGPFKEVKLIFCVVFFIGISAGDLVPFLGWENDRD